MQHLTIFAGTTLVLACTLARAADYEGTAVAVDGDTIELHVGDKVMPVTCGDAGGVTVTVTPDALYVPLRPPRNP